ncbi:MAG: threonine synthase [Lachnospiraceae bacterium]|nr:threonine synthase [Parasporobacterium sp.]MBR6357945.1 threonine synthase [Lachnospiraceae bacterium]
MEIRYKSTRGNGETITASEAILKGLADDGGLFVPTAVPSLECDLASLADMNYREVAYLVMSKFFSDFTEKELKNCIDHAYDSKFDTPEIAPLVSAGKYELLELFHGATIAFKDMALSILPHLLTTAAKKNAIENEIVILTATSGDTGKAALAGFADVPGTRIIVFYPKGGVSHVQELQMVTQKGENTFVVGVNGNFDDAQTGVKKMFNDSALKAQLNENHFQFSSANSINIGRLVPQVAYYVWAYGQMCKKGKIAPGEKINFVVPTGNFGNILAGYFAKQMGVPVGRLICASNDNKVLYDFFKTGVYDRKRKFILTSSPSMDILISSNLERLIYLITGESEENNRLYMKQLNVEGRYEISKEQKSHLSDFFGGFATEAENAAGIRKHFEEEHYITDTHTGVAVCVYDKYVEETGDTTPAVIVSTASPYKFARSVMTAIDEKYDAKDDFALIQELNNISGIPIPNAIVEILNADIRHKTVCNIDEMEKEVKGFLKI